ncbi:hypothetical protein G5C60_12370 [Streptomyces sp. HC44]|uniref:Uncharacterized protein n=1 Tax=Streptomyces scabichelini TaxID=2711217 RepID=A0A6G4V388_9ACTN|nr:hypothetical protein [Streptomyces scabichelini]NGO08395.1 hypothetical protein [Streptomyces scabichelini]
MRRRRTAIPGGANNASHRYDAGAPGDGSTTRLRLNAASKATHLSGAQERQALR